MGIVLKEGDQSREISEDELRALREREAQSEIRLVQEDDGGLRKLDKLKS